MKRYYFNNDLKFSVSDMPDENILKNQVRIKMKNCGICGSDIHYFLKGENGGRKILEPLMLGHEAVGEIIETGKNVNKLKIGDRVAINPASYCENCFFCKIKKYNLCENVLFFGSAATLPHTQGAFRENIEVPEKQCFKLNDLVSYDKAAFAEPLAVSLHAISFVNNFINKKILISGCGPIGLLILKIAITKIPAKNIFVIDINNNVLESAKKQGDINTINLSDKTSFIKEYSNFFDIAFEASGSIPSIENIIKLLRKGGTVIQVGNMPGGQIKIEYNKFMIKELKLFGSYRFSEEFKEAVESINNNIFDFQDMLTHKFKLSDCEKAMKTASNKNISIKVQVYN